MKLSVRDTGMGINQGNIGKLFKLFGQVSSTKKINENGIGLGLAISKCLVEKFMGEIYVDTRLNKGSKFTFKIMVQQITVISENSNLSMDKRVSS